MSYVTSYIQSIEAYKGFTLNLVMTRLDNQSLKYHRSCEVFKGDTRVSICKTKKEAKDLIDGGYIV